jgi:hypothetical protein
VIRLRHDTCVVVEDVQPPVGRNGVIDHAFGIGLIADVGADEGRLAARLLDRFNRLVAGRLVELRDHDLRALRGEELGRHAAHAASRPGDDCDLAVESHQPRSR